MLGPRPHPLDPGPQGGGVSTTLGPRGRLGLVSLPLAICRERPPAQDLSPELGEPGVFGVGRVGQQSQRCVVVAAVPGEPQRGVGPGDGVVRFGPSGRRWTRPRLRRGLRGLGGPRPAQGARRSRGPRRSKHRRAPSKSPVRASSSSHADHPKRLWRASSSTMRRTTGATWGASAWRTTCASRGGPGDRVAGPQRSRVFGIRLPAQPGDRARSPAPRDRPARAHGHPRPRGTGRDRHPSRRRCAQRPVRGAGECGRTSVCLLPPRSHRCGEGRGVAGGPAHPVVGQHGALHWASAVLRHLWHGRAVDPLRLPRL